MLIPAEVVLGGSPYLKNPAASASLSRE